MLAQDREQCTNKYRSLMDGLNIHGLSQAHPIRCISGSANDETQRVPLWYNR